MQEKQETCAKMIPQAIYRRLFNVIKRYANAYTSLTYGYDLWMYLSAVAYLDFIEGWVNINSKKKYSYQ